MRPSTVDAGVDTSRHTCLANWHSGLRGGEWDVCTRGTDRRGSTRHESRRPHKSELVGATESMRRRERSERDHHVGRGLRQICYPANRPASNARRRRPERERKEKGMLLCLVPTLAAAAAVPRLIHPHPGRGGGCEFPQRWRGVWFQKGAHPAISIERTQITFKGTCVQADGDMFLIEDRRERCFRCVAIYEKHENVLQYRETYCDEFDNLKEACHLLNVDAHLHSLFRVEASPVACPFRGPLTFTYNRGHGECRHPVSTVDSCSADWRILFRFQACADVHGTESSVEELTCLATWKEGSAYYLVGKMVQRKLHALPYSDGDSYRCFVYEHVGHQNSFRVSQSPDATCDGLVSASEGSRIMTLTKSRQPSAGCHFPPWSASGSRRWHSLDGRRSFVFGSRQMRVHRAQHSSGETQQPELRVTCIQELAQGTNASTLVGYSTSGCNNGYVCVAIHRRDSHVLEIQMGLNTIVPTPTNTALHRGRPRCAALSAPFGGDGSALSHPCPALALTDGLRATGRASWKPDGCRDVLGCRRHSHLEFRAAGCGGEEQVLSAAATSPAAATPRALVASRTFQCHGGWQENGRNYLITGLKGSKDKFCFVFSEADKVTQLSGLHDTCRRTVLPGVTGNITFNISAAANPFENSLASLSTSLVLPSAHSSLFAQVTATSNRAGRRPSSPPCRPCHSFSRLCFACGDGRSRGDGLRRGTDPLPPCLHPDQYRPPEDAARRRRTTTVNTHRRRRDDARESGASQPFGVCLLCMC
ncbi:hypothetical protein HPB51_004461 [Rhipicephalus microplus]|uniref:Uncharacterized protein n=1 Tax=Rhipicephalus microplus TaxID=6941 RepID=A0A9J6EM58_RHIMP|nr:hypothetical protein HPB51_004461 [Rhipicephalus microplus]